jgi:transposase
MRRDDQGEKPYPIQIAALQTQAVGDWIGAHTGAFEAVGGVPSLLVLDNAKVVVIKACLYEPQVNRTYAEMARISIQRSCRPDRAGHATRPRSKPRC